MQTLATLNTRRRLVERLSLNNAGYKVGVKPATSRELHQQPQNSAEHAQQVASKPKVILDDKIAPQSKSQLQETVHSNLKTTDNLIVEDVQAPNNQVNV